MLRVRSREVVLYRLWFFFHGDLADASRKYKRRQLCSSLRGVEVKWTRSQAHFKVGSLSKRPGFLLPVSRNLGRRDWPIAGQPSRGNATLCLACGKGRNLRLRIYCQSLGRTPGCVLNFRFNQGKQGGLQWTAAWWNPQNQQQTNSWSGPGDGVDRDARSNEMADRAHSRPVESSFKS
jgi:hypothetical protein